MKALRGDDFTKYALSTTIYYVQLSDLEMSRSTKKKKKKKKMKLGSKYDLLDAPSNLKCTINHYLLG